MIGIMILLYIILNAFKVNAIKNAIYKSYI